MCLEKVWCHGQVGGSPEKNETQKQMECKNKGRGGKCMHSIIFNQQSLLRKVKANLKCKCK